MGQDFGQHPVEFVEQAVGVGALAPLGGPQGACGHRCGAHLGQLVDEAALALPHAGHVPEFRVHGAGAHGAHLDAPGPQLLVEGLGKGQHIGLGGAVHRHAGGGGKGGDGGHVQHQAVVQHIGQAQPGNGGEGPAVQVHHAGLGGAAGGEEIAGLAVAGIVHQHLDLRLVLL